MVFNGSCAVSASCHSGTNSAGYINFDAKRASADLIADMKKPSMAWPGQGPLAVPEMPDASFLVHKVQGDLPCLKDNSCGEIMPQTGPHLLAPQIQIVRAWIEQGMPDNLALRRG